MKKFKYILLSLMLFMFPVLNVLADTTTDQGEKKLVYIVGVGLFIIRIVVPVILIVIASFDLVKAMTQNDEREMKKVITGILPKVLSAIMIFLLPSLVSLLLTLTKQEDIWNDNVTCLLKPFECDVELWEDPVYSSSSDFSSSGSSSYEYPIDPGEPEKVKVGVFVPDEGTLATPKCSCSSTKKIYEYEYEPTNTLVLEKTTSGCKVNKAEDLGVFKGFYFIDHKPYSTEDRWSIEMCKGTDYFTTVKTTCSNGTVYRWEVNKLAKTAFKKVQEKFCEITTTGIDGIVYKPKDITISGPKAVRYISDKKVLSLHSYGIAIDINPSKDYVIDGKTYEKPYGRDLSKYNSFISALGREDDPRNVNYILWKKVFAPLGFRWGGNWGRDGKGTKIDGMHFEIDWRKK